MGIERLCAILMEQDNLRDVTMFPLMKPQHEKSETSENEILTTSYE
jgi:aspartyl-tRNA synthetase